MEKSDPVRLRLEAMAEIARLLDTAESSVALLLIAHSLLRIAEDIEALEARPPATIHYLDESRRGKPETPPEEG